TEGVGRTVCAGNSKKLRQPSSRDLTTIAVCFVTEHKDSGSESRRPSYFFSRIKGVKVIPTNIPSGSRNLLTVWPHGSFLLLRSIRYPCDSSFAVALSTFSTSNSSQACGTGRSAGQESRPKHDCAACESGHRAKCFAPLRAPVWRYPSFSSLKDIPSVSRYNLGPAETSRTMGPKPAIN